MVDATLPSHIQLIESPDWYEPRPDERTVFLAGGIPNVAPWHDRAVELLARAARPIAILNPRRRQFPIGDHEAVRQQVRWEHHHLHQPGGITLFWFGACDPAVTVQPTTLLELGQALGEGRRIVVGADPGYPRRDILEHQLAQHDGIPLHATLEDTVSSVLRVFSSAGEW
jgi:hypothetical protein